MSDNHELGAGVAVVDMDTNLIQEPAVQPHARTGVARLPRAVNPMAAPSESTVFRVGMAPAGGQVQIRGAGLNFSSLVADTHTSADPASTNDQILNDLREDLPAGLDIPDVDLLNMDRRSVERTNMQELFMADPVIDMLILIDGYGSRTSVLVKELFQLYWEKHQSKPAAHASRVAGAGPSMGPAAVPTNGTSAVSADANDLDTEAMAASIVEDPNSIETLMLLRNSNLDASTQTQIVDNLLRRATRDKQNERRSIARQYINRPIRVGMAMLPSRTRAGIEYAFAQFRLHVQGYSRVDDRDHASRLDAVVTEPTVRGLFAEMAAYGMSRKASGNNNLDANAVRVGLNETDYLNLVARIKIEGVWYNPASRTVQCRPQTMSRRLKPKPPGRMVAAQYRVARRMRKLGARPAPY